MAKRKRQPSNKPRFNLNLGGGGGGGGGGGMANKIQELQQQMVDTQNALAEETVEISSGGGVVTIEMNGQQKINKITIDPAVVDPEDVEMLQDLIMAAVNEAVDKTQEIASERLGGLTSGLNIPGLGGLF